MIKPQPCTRCKHSVETHTRDTTRVAMDMIFDRKKNKWVPAYYHRKCWDKTVADYQKNTRTRIK